MKSLFFTAIFSLSFGLCAAVAFGCGGDTKVGSGARRPRVDYGRVLTPQADGLTPYSDEQLDLLNDSPQTLVPAPVRRVLPDLTKFRYASNHRMEDPAEGASFTRLVATVLTESPHLYVISGADRGIENPEIQYGKTPAFEPDPWLKVVPEPAGGGRLESAMIGDRLRYEFEQSGGFAWEKSPDKARSIRLLTSVIMGNPQVPALWILLGDVQSATGDFEGAIHAYGGALAQDDSLAAAHAGLAEVYEKRGERAAARREAAEALAYQPLSKRAAAIGRRLAFDGINQARVSPYSLFLDVTAMGAIRVATLGGGPGQMYGSCRAVVRYEPRVRAAIFEVPEETPYFLSVIEEVICLEAAIGAYIVERRSDKSSPRDATVEALWDIAQNEGLLGYVMFEIIGQNRPERARLAPPDVHKAIVNYVTKHVIGEREELPDGIYNAMAEPR